MGSRPPAPLAPSVPGSVRVVLGLRNVGVLGYLAGPDVHLTDLLGLADPVAARLTLVERSRPGHEKVLPDAWVVARFGDPEAARARFPAAADAARAMECGDLAVSFTPSPIPSPPRDSSPIWVPRGRFTGCGFPPILPPPLSASARARQRPAAPRRADPSPAEIGADAVGEARERTCAWPSPCWRSAALGARPARLPLHAVHLRRRPDLAPLRQATARRTGAHLEFRGTGRGLFEPALGAERGRARLARVST